MADFPEYPTREELYAKVDDWFRQTHTDAPDHLDPSDPSQARWITEWMRIRDELLNAEVNRVYWETYPDAPHKIDPSNPEHHAYQSAWMDIRANILDNGPEIPHPSQQEIEDAQTAALESFGVAVREDVDALTHDLPDDLHSPMWEAAEADLEAVEAAYRNGLIGEAWWWAPGADLTSTSDPSKHVHLRVVARVHAGKVDARLHSVVS